MNLDKVTCCAVGSWVLYEGANAPYATLIMSFIFAPYYAQKIAVDPLSGVMQWGYSIAFAGLIVGIIGPLVGVVADMEGRLKKRLGIFTILTSCSAAMLWFAKPTPSYAIPTLFWVIVGVITFEMSGIFYNAMLRHIVQPKYLGRVSGWARSIGYIGSTVSLMIVLFFVIQPTTSFLPVGTAIDIRVRLCGPFTAIWLVVFALPLFIFTTDSVHIGSKVKYPFKESILGLRKNLGRLMQSHRSVIWLIGANVFFLDGLNTLSAMGGIYLANIFHLSASKIIQFGVMMSIFAALGTMLLSRLSDDWGEKSIILTALIILTFLTVFMFFTSSYFWFQIIVMMGSVLVGSVLAASRSLIARIAPINSLAEVFSLYAIAGRVTSFLGPLLASMVIWVSSNQRIGMLIVPGFLLIGAIFLWFVDVPVRKVYLRQ